LIQFNLIFLAKHLDLAMCKFELTPTKEYPV
jgi:hypothetical protein